MEESNDTNPLLDWRLPENPEAEGCITAATTAPELTYDIVATPGEDGRPDPKWIRGKCPVCGDDLVSNLYYLPGVRYLGSPYVVMWECWSAMGEHPTCVFGRTL